MGEVSGAVTFRHFLFLAGLGEPDRLPRLGHLSTWHCADIQGLSIFVSSKGNPLAPHPLWPWSVRFSRAKVHIFSGIYSAKRLSHLIFDAASIATGPFFSTFNTFETYLTRNSHTYSGRHAIDVRPRHPFCDLFHPRWTQTSSSASAMASKPCYVYRTHKVWLNGIPRIYSQRANHDTKS